MSDPILFEAFDTGDSSGDGVVALAPFEVFGYNGALAFGRVNLLRITTYGIGVITRTGVGSVTLPLAVYGDNRRNAGYARLAGFGVYGTEIGIKPNVALGIVTLPVFTVYGAGVITRFGAGICYLGNIRVRGLQNANFGGVTLAQLRVRGDEVIHNDRVLSVIQSPGYMFASVGGPTILAYVDDNFVAADAINADFILQAIEQLLGLTSTGTSLAGLSGVVERISASDFGALVFQLIAADDLTIEADPFAYLNNLLAVADAVFATGTVGTSFVNALLYVALVAELGDRADPVIFLSVADTMAALDAASLARVSLMVAALDSMTLADTATGTLRLVLLAADNATLADANGTALQGLIEALDAGLFTGRLSLGGTSYSVYALTLQGQAPSEYTNFDFDSYATIGGHLYAVGPQGLVLCEGGDDDGAPINAEIRRGLSTLGTEFKKSVPYAYIGYTSTGSLVLETTTTDKRTKRVNRYKLSLIATPAFSDGRFKIAEGLQATYWDFTLKNLEGADFEIDFVKVWRVPLSRRK